MAVRQARLRVRVALALVGAVAVGVIAGARAEQPAAALTGVPVFKADPGWPVLPPTGRGDR